MVKVVEGVVGTRRGGDFKSVSRNDSRSVDCRDSRFELLLSEVEDEDGVVDAGAVEFVTICRLT